MPGFDNGNNVDYMGSPWWTTSSGTQSWTADYTRSRSGLEPTYSGVDTIIGRKDSIQDVNP